MLRIVNLLISFAAVAGVTACCCPCGRIPFFVPKPVPIEVPIPQPAAKAKVKGEDQPANDQNANKKKNGDAKELEDMFKKFDATVTRDPKGSITVVSIFDKNFSDSDLKKLAAADKLDGLILSDTAITGAAFKDLADLQYLKALHIDRCRKLSKQGMSNLGNLGKLKQLSAISSSLDDAGMKEVAKLSQLTYVAIYNTKVTDVGLLELTKLKNLDEAFIDKSVSPKTLDALKKALPDCRFETR